MVQSNTVSSLKPNRGRSWKRLRRIQIVCRLESQFVPDADIANVLGLTVAALHHIKKCVEYQALKIELQTGVISVYTKQMLADQDSQREKIEELIPMALNAIENVILDRNHPAHAKVALDLMDRNRATAKITKMEHSLAAAVSTSKEDARARSLLALMASPDPDLPQDAGVNKTRSYDTVIGLPAPTNKAQQEADDLSLDADQSTEEDDLIGEGPADIDKLTSFNGL